MNQYTCFKRQRRKNFLRALLVWVLLLFIAGIVGRMDYEEAKQPKNIFVETLK